MKFSVIVPVFNAEKTIRCCVDSILNQTFQDFELILINDGSVDSSLQIIEEYAKKDYRIYTINQKNQGVSTARNQGLKIAKGEYIVFIDSDDYIDPSYLEEFSKSSADIIICGFKTFGGKISNETFPKFYSDNWEEIITRFDQGFPKPNFCTPWAKAIRNQLFKKVNKWFLPELRTLEDAELVIRLLKYTSSMAILPSSGYNYHVTVAMKYQLNADEYKQHASLIFNVIPYVGKEFLPITTRTLSCYLLGDFTSFLWSKPLITNIIQDLKYFTFGFRYAKHRSILRCYIGVAVIPLSRAVRKLFRSK